MTQTNDSVKKATRTAYGEALVGLSEKNEKIVVLDADLSHATMTYDFSKKYGDRFFNMGIAEANMICMAAGLSAMGYIPFVSTFAIFGAGRAYEQIRNSVAYPHTNVKIALTHSGVTIGEDGGSHASIEDIALMRVIPGMTIICPSDALQTRKAIQAAAEFSGPCYIRLARMASPILKEMPFEIGRANILAEGEDVVIIACGLMVHIALKARELLRQKNIHSAVVDMHTIKPVDKVMIRRLAERFSKIVTLEEHSIIGGLGDAVRDELPENIKIKKLGVTDVFGQSGKPEHLLQHYRLDAVSVMQDIMEAMFQNF